MQVKNHVSKDKITLLLLKIYQILQVGKVGQTNSTYLYPTMHPPLPSLDIMNGCNGTIKICNKYLKMIYL